MHVKTTYIRKIVVLCISDTACQKRTQLSYVSSFDMHMY